MRRRINELVDVVIDPVYKSQLWNGLGAGGFREYRIAYRIEQSAAVPYTVLAKIRSSIRTL